MLIAIAAISGGYCGAKLAGWVNEAALCAMHEKSRTIEIDHFDAAKTLIEVGVKLPEIFIRSQSLRTACQMATRSFCLLKKRISIKMSC